MVWMGMAQPPAWQLVLYLLCIGMFGAGVGMLYTPILVDRLQLTFPSGLAVANILRALTDPVLLRASVRQLGGGIALGIGSGLAAAKVAALGAIELSASTFGAGMVVGARIGVPAMTAGVIGTALVPYFVSIGWLQAGDPARKIMFLIGLGLIMGAAAVDLSIIFWQAARRLTGVHPAPTAGPPAGAPGSEWKRVNSARLWAWVLAWGTGIVVTGHSVLGQPVGFLVFAVALVFVFAMVNGISLGVSDSNPISSAFVVSVVLMAALGLKDPGVGLMAGTRAAGLDQRGLRHAAGPVHRLAPRHQPRAAVPLPGRRHPDGGGARGRLRASLHGRLSGAAARPDGDEGRRAAGRVERGDDLQVRRRAEEPDRRQALPADRHLDRRGDRPGDRGAPEPGCARARPTGGSSPATAPASPPTSPSMRCCCHRRMHSRSAASSACTRPCGSARAASSPVPDNSLPHRRAATALPADMSGTSLLGGGLIAGDALAALGLGIAALLTTVIA